MRRTRVADNRKGVQLGAAVGILICGIVMTAFEIVFDEPMKYVADNMMIYFGMVATVFTVKAVKLRAKHEIVLAALLWAFFVFFTAVFVLSFIKMSRGKFCGCSDCRRSRTKVQKSAERNRHKNE